jgi:hypothetical protein
MNHSKKLLFFLLIGIVGHTLTKEYSQKVAPLAAATLMNIISDTAEIKNLIVTAYNSLPPAEQQQIIATLVNLLLESLQKPQPTTNTQAATVIQPTNPQATTNNTQPTTTPQ